ncbi:MAG: hypothetical protein SH856_03040 [Flavobacteriales bacterium]|nr:hypothetical protein [Flavobacteriales bacterium]
MFKFRTINSTGFFRLSPAKALFFVAYIITAIFCEGFFHVDEHFQILEFANWKMGHIPAGDLPWEFAEKMRPALQPALACAVWEMWDAMGYYTPFRVITVLRLLSALMAFAVAALMLRKINSDFPATNKWNLFLMFGLWFSLFCGVRFSSENWSGLMFAFAFLLLAWPVGKSSQDLRGKQWTFLLAGFLLGLSFVLRFQSAFLVAGLLAWFIFIQRAKWNQLAIIATGGCIAVAIGLLVDRWFYGQWVITAWNYFSQNLLLGKVNTFGTNPWYYYFEAIFLRGIPPLSIVVIIAVVLGIILKPKHALSFSLLPFFLVHFLIAHKEERFMFPLVPLVPLAMIVAYHAIKEREKLWRWFNSGVVKWTLRISIVVNVCLIPYVMFFSANERIELFRFLYELQKHEPIQVYCLEPSPIHNKVSIAFYNGPQMTSLLLTKKQLKVLDPVEGTYLIIPKLQEKQIERFGNRLERVYSTYPDWVLQFNFNNWLNRTGVWRVYKVRA